MFSKYKIKKAGRSYKLYKKNWLWFCVNWAHIGSFSSLSEAEQFLQNNVIKLKGRSPETYYDSKGNRKE